MSTEKDLTDMIAEIVSTKTFNLDALDAIQSIKAKAVELEKALERATAHGKQMQFERGNLQSALSTETGRVKLWEAREAELATREKAAFELEKAAAVSAAVAATWEKSFGMVFKNTTVRENVVATAGASMPGGGWSNTNENKTVTREQD